MKNSLLSKFNATRRALEQERDKCLARASEIDSALNQTSSSNGHVRSSAPRSPANNKLSLREAITQAVKSRPLDKKEIVAAVERLGYRFTTNKPIQSVSALVYSEAGKAQFRNQNGRFSAK